MYLLMKYTFIINTDKLVFIMTFSCSFECWAKMAWPPIPETINLSSTLRELWTTLLFAFHQPSQRLRSPLHHTLIGNTNTEPLWDTSARARRCDHPSLSRISAQYHQRVQSGNLRPTMVIFLADDRRADVISAIVGRVQLIFACSTLGCSASGNTSDG